jgi:hypothetical protein
MRITGKKNRPEIKIIGEPAGNRTTFRDTGSPGPLGLVINYVKISLE